MFSPSLGDQSRKYGSAAPDRVSPSISRPFKGRKTISFSKYSCACFRAFIYGACGGYTPTDESKSQSASSTRNVRWSKTPAKKQCSLDMGKRSSTRVNLYGD